jgi:hypothetical protein
MGNSGKRQMRPVAQSFFRTPLSMLMSAAMMLAAMAGYAAAAGEQCATEPNLKASAGHWYYQIDRSSRRKCWFLGRPGMKVRPAAVARTAAKIRPPAAAGRDRPGIGDGGCPCPDEPIAPIPAASSEPSGFEPVSLAAIEPVASSEPDSTDGTARPQAAPAAAAAVMQTLPESISVAPVQLLALLAAALGLAAGAVRLIFRYGIARTSPA